MAVSQPVLGACAASARPTADVREKLARVAREHPLLETRPSLRAVREADGAMPRAVFAGIGLVSDSGLSRALPLDALGLVLSAESVRRSVDADELLVLVADTHATCWGVPEAAVQPRAEAYERVLQRIAERCGLRRMRLLRASQLHCEPAYRRVLRRVEQNAANDAEPYVTREVADIAHFVDTYGAVVKVGWALKPARRGAERDERHFDECYERWVGGGAWFLYGKAGRTLDDRKRKAPPYAETDASRRVLLRPGEDAAEKLARGREQVSHSTWRGVRNHLSLIARTYGKLVRPLEGTLEERVQAILDDVLEDGARPALLAER